MSRQPDVLIVMADQLAVSALPFHGNPVTRAPHLNGLAERGVVFDAAYTASPLCAPARASLMTSLLPSTTGTFDNAAAFSSEIPTFAHYLRSAGYRTVLAGKMHFCGPDQRHGFEERLTTDIYPADFGWSPDWSRPDHRPSWYHDMSSVLDAGPCIRTNQLDFDDEVAFAAERLLYEHIRSADDRPLCLVASFTHPHDPYATPQEWWDLYEDVEIPMPLFGYDDSIAQPHERRLSQMCAIEGADLPDERVRAARRAYYGSISYVDAQIGRLLRILDESGLRDDTVVVVTSDHGDMLGERGLWYKMSLFEGSVRVPLVVCAPRLFSAGRVATPVSTMDLLPTLVGLADEGDVARIVGPVDGESLLPLLSGTSTAHRPVRAEYLAEGAITPIVMVRRDRFKFVASPSDPDQLYDLVSDPYERSNLADDPAFADLVAEFRADVDTRWDLETIDTRVRHSQAQRLVVAAALGVGEREWWDFAPPYDASSRYVRGHMDLGDIEQFARYPRVTGLS